MSPPDAGEVRAMTDEWVDREEAAPARRRRRRGRRRAGEAEGPPLSDEEIAYRRARRVAEERLRAVRDVLTWALGSLLLVWLLKGFGVLIAVLWGIHVGRDAFSVVFSTVVAPNLRERWIEEEVDRQLHTKMSDERARLEGQHTRSVERLSASIAHEIRNPITAAKSLVQQMGEDPGSPEHVEYAQVALEELDRVERSISHLLRFAREEDIRVAEVSLARVLDSALESFRDRLGRLGVEVVRDYDGDGQMRGDAEQLRRVLINLVGNALDALEAVGSERPRLVVQVGENLAGNEVWLRIRDNGPGMDAHTLEKIWSPLYTSKSGGTGLGLAISKKVVDRHGGGIEAHSQPSRGTELVLTFPKRGPDGGEEA